MSTVNINELKIRALQLKGIGYDKLLIKENLVSQLNHLEKELNAIAAEVKNIMTTLEQIEVTSEKNKANISRDNEIDNDNDEPNSIQHRLPQDTVDEKELGYILTPQSEQNKGNKDRKNKTTHTIGRRT